MTLFFAHSQSGKKWLCGNPRPEHLNASRFVGRRRRLRGLRADQLQVGGVTLGGDDRVAVGVPAEGLGADLPVGPARVAAQLPVVDEVPPAGGFDEAAVTAAGEDRLWQLL